MELKRALFNRKLFILTFAVLVFNCFAFTVMQTSQYADKEVSVFSVSRIINEFCEEYKGMSVADAYELNQNRIRENEFFNIMNICCDKEHELYAFYKEIQIRQEQENPELAHFYYENKALLTDAYCLNRTYALRSINTQLEYLLNFDDKFELIESNLKILKQSSVMQTRYALTDGEKTRDDYYRIKNVELTFDDYRAQESVLSFSLPLFFSLVPVFAVLLSFMDDRKDGLYAVVRSTKNGRIVLELKRIGILFALSIVYPLALYGSLIPIASAIYGGFGLLSANVQSSVVFADVTFPVSFGEFALIKLILISLGIFAFSMFMHFVFFVFKSFRIALSCIIASTAVQWLFYTYISEQSIFSVFKYANFIAGINLSSSVLTYGNIPVISLAVDKNAVTAVFSVFAATIFTACCLVTVKRDFSLSIPKTVESIGSFVFRIKDRILCSGGLTLKELNKVLFSQKGLILLTVMFAVLFGTVDFSPVKYSAYDGIINEFYKSYNGKTATEAREYLCLIENKIFEIDTEGADIALDVRYLTQAYDTIDSYLDYLESAERAGYAVKVVNPRAYEHLFAFSYARDRVIYNVSAVIFLVLILSDVFTYEEGSCVKDIVFSTQKGRRKLFTAKLAASVILSLFIFVSVFGIQFIHIYSLFGIENFEVPVQSIKALSECKFSLSAGEFLLYNLAARMVLFISAAVVICFAGAGLKKERTVAVITMTVFLLPEILSASGIRFFDSFSLIKSLDSPLFLYCGLYSYGFFAVVSILFCIKTKRGNLRGYFA